MKRNPTRQEIRKAMQTQAALSGKFPDSGMTLDQLIAMRTAMRSAAARVEAIKATCHNCEHFSMDRCSHHNQDVPVEFQRQVEQCGAWVFDGVPF